MLWWNLHVHVEMLISIVCFPPVVLYCLWEENIKLVRNAFSLILGFAVFSSSVLRECNRYFSSCVTKIPIVSLVPPKTADHQGGTWLIVLGDVFMPFHKAQVACVSQDSDTMGPASCCVTPSDLQGCEQTASAGSAFSYSQGVLFALCSLIMVFMSTYAQPQSVCSERATHQADSEGQ